MYYPIFLQFPIFNAISDGALTHLSVKDDSNYEVGDKIHLIKVGESNSKKITVEVTYITNTKSPCAFSREALAPDYCILSIRKIDDANSNVDNEQGSEAVRADHPEPQA